MSCIEYHKLILAITDLIQLFQDWNIKAIDAAHHSDILKLESSEVFLSCEKSLHYADEVLETDRDSISQSKNKCDKLQKNSSEIHEQTKELSEEAVTKTSIAEQTLNEAYNTEQRAAQWNSIASNEYKTAEAELELAKTEYRIQQNITDSARSRLESTPQTITVNVWDGDGKSHLERRKNPEYEIALSEYNAAVHALNIAINKLNEKRQFFNNAKHQLHLSKEALEISHKIMTNSTDIIHQTEHFSELSENALTSAIYSLDSISTAINYNDDAYQQNVKQIEVQEELKIVFEQLKTKSSELHNYIHKISEISDSCYNINNKFISILDNKTNILNRLSSITPDDITPFITE